MKTFLAVTFALGLASPAFAQDAPDKKEDLSSYTVDFNPGTVSAGGLIGLKQSAIQQIQSSQDIVVALKPFTSGNSKAGFGVAITPARTSFLGMSARDYVEKPLMRALGSLTLSYAEAGATIRAATYRKYAVSADMFFYWNLREDPIAIAHKQFEGCNERPDMKDQQSTALGALGKANIALERARAGGDPKAIDRAEDAYAKAERAYIDIVDKCMDEGGASANLRTPWNATRFAVSLGAGWIRPESNPGSRESLGRAITFGGTIMSGKQGAFDIALRRNTKEADLSTLGGPVQHKSSSLAAVRYTYGSKDDNGSTKGLAELSNAKKSDITEANRVFKYAIGLDKKLAKGTWLQFRFGRNRTIDGTSTETTGLMNITLQPSAGLFK